MLLSVITINRNNADGLRKTIESVIAQTFQEFEYIVIDGASTDESVEIIKSYKHIDYWVSEPDTGIYHAMNKGIKKASGGYLLFLNSGDYLVDRWVFEQTDLKSKTQDILYGDLVFENTNRKRIQHFPQKITFYWLYTQYLGHASTFIRKSLFDKVGFYNESLKIVSDWEFFLLAIAIHNCSMFQLNYVVSVLVEGGISNNEQFREKVKQERQYVMKNKFPVFESDYEQLYDLRHNKLSKKIKRKIKQFLNIFKSI